MFSRLNTFDFVLLVNCKILVLIRIYNVLFFIMFRVKMGNRMKIVSTVPPTIHCVWNIYQTFQCIVFTPLHNITNVAIEFTTLHNNVAILLTTLRLLRMVHNGCITTLRLLRMFLQRCSYYICNIFTLYCIYPED